MLRYLVTPLLLVLSLCAHSSWAQPTQVPSTIKKPFAGGIPAPVPDPPQITPAELQKLTGGPTLVTFSGTDLSLTEVGKALFDAARLPENKDYMLGLGKISVDWNQTPFWIAAADMEKQTGSVWRAGFGETLNLVPFKNSNEGGLDGKLVARTPYISLIANSITNTQTNTNLFRQNQAPIVPGVPAPFDGARITLSAYLDPTLRMRSVTLRSLNFQKQGEATPIAQENRNFSQTYTRGPITQIILSVPKAVGAGTTLSRISGVLHLVLISATQPINVPDLAATPQLNKEINGLRYALESASVTGDSLTFRLSANDREPGGRDQVFFTDLFMDVRVRGAQGQVLRRGSSSDNYNDFKTQTDFSFSLRNIQGQIPGPYSLEWPIITETRSLDVPFELRDVVVREIEFLKTKRAANESWRLFYLSFRS